MGHSNEKESPYLFFAKRNWSQVKDHRAKAVVLRDSVTVTL